MNQTFGQLNQSFKSIWVSNSGAVAEGVELPNLVSEAIGVFPAAQYCKNGVVESLTAPTFKKAKRVVIKQGIVPFSGQDVTFLSRQDKRARSTREFEAKDIVAWKGIKSKNNQQKTQKVILGYDGIDASRSLNAKLDAKPFHVNIILSGEPIKRFFHTNRIVHRLVIDKGLCQSDCECIDTCGKVPCDRIADHIVKAVNNDSLFAQIGGKMVSVPLKQFVKASKISKCTTAATATPVVEYQKWAIEICDDGKSTLGALAQAYPNVKIKLEKRIDSISTYTFWKENDETTPADFTLSTHVQPICGTCPTCPTTYTSVPALKVVQVRVAYKATAPTLTGSVASSKVSSTLTGGDVYIIKVPVSQTESAIEAQLTTVVDYEFLGDETQLCVGSNATFEWASCEVCYRTEKAYMIVLPDGTCGATDRLPELTEAYPELVITDYSPEVTGTCLSAYQTTVLSDCLPAEDCGKEVVYNFKAPVSFQGQLWVEKATISNTVSCTPVTPEAEPCCVCGVVFETGVWNKRNDTCKTEGWHNWHPNDIKPVLMTVNVHSFDYSDNPCDETKTMTRVVQNASFDLGTSGWVVQEYERNFLMYENKFWSQNPFVNEATGFSFTAKTHLNYDQYVLTLKNVQFGNTYLAEHQDTIDYVFYVPAGSGKNLERVINSLVLSTGNPDLKAVIL